MQSAQIQHAKRAIHRSHSIWILQIETGMGDQLLDARNIGDRALRLQIEPQVNNQSLLFPLSVKVLQNFFAHRFFNFR